MLKDMMTGFELLEPTTVDGALDLMAQHGDQGWVLAGGHAGHENVMDIGDQAAAGNPVNEIHG